MQLFGSCLQASCLHSPEYLNEDYKGGVFLEFLGERSHLVKDLMQTHLAHTCFSEECFSIRFAVTWKATETRRMIAAHYGDRNRFRIREIRYYLSLLPFLFLVTSMFFVLVTHVFFFFLSLSLFVVSAVFFSGFIFLLLYAGLGCFFVLLMFCFVGFLTIHM